jgi:hypothetical protein
VCCVPILDSTFRRTTSARRPSKSTVPPRRAASSASSYFIPVGLPSSVIRTVYQRPVRKVLRPGLYRAPAFIVLLAALLLSSRSWRGRSLCALEALRRTLGGATMTIPGGVSTPRKACHNFPVLGASASIMGSELQPPALLLALIHRSAWKWNSPKFNFRFTEFSEVRGPFNETFTRTSPSGGCAAPTSGVRCPLTQQARGAIALLLAPRPRRKS